MSVFTPVSVLELQAWLETYAIGELVDLKGISSGITNTNYFVTTKNNDATHRQFVLTLFEHNQLDELHYYIELMRHLAVHEIPCPLPIFDASGLGLKMLNGKPAALMSCLNGRDVEGPNLAQCAAVGTVLAKMHIAGQSFEAAFSDDDSRNQRGLSWRVATAAQVMPHLSAADQQLLAHTLDFQANLNTAHLPKGVIHADLFRDNVLFEGDKIGGLIDFYYACHDVLAYDVAIAVNDWCIHQNGALDEAKFNAMFHAYQAVRPFNTAEHEVWPAMLRIAALRFWLSRLYDYFYPKSGELTHLKDPHHFKKILQLRTSAAQSLSLIPN